MNMLIRRMKLEDVPAVHEIDMLSFTLPWSERSFRYEITENPVSRGWVVEVDGQVIAMLVLWLIVDEAHIATIAVHPNFRRQGMGEADFNPLSAGSPGRRSTAGFSGSAGREYCCPVYV